MLHPLRIVWLIGVLGLTVGAVRGQDAVVPREVKVLPVFFVPKGEPPPTDDQTKRLIRHLDWCRTRYRELLPGQATFSIAQQKPLVYKSSRPLPFYRSQPEASAPQVVSELLAELKYNRFNCPFVLLSVTMNAKDDFPVGGGRPLNGGVNTGGGILIISSFALDKAPNFQSTLQHELGHAFGLPHVEVYGYDMRSNDSIMSYNQSHHTNGFKPSRTPGRLIPEDLRALALNQRVFPNLRFDPERDVPRGYSLAKGIVTLGPMTIPGQPQGPVVTTTSGETFGSKVGNIVQGQILPSKKEGKVTYDQRSMWHSAETKTGWVSVQVAFPYEVELTRVAVHSQHSGDTHAARAAKVAVRDGGAQFRQVVEADLKSVDEIVTMPKTKGRVWRFEFRAGETRFVVLRGLRFFSGEDELFPPLVPYPG
jgi:hypothetical protein